MLTTLELNVLVEGDCSPGEKGGYLLPDTDPEVQLRRVWVSHKGARVDILPVLNSRDKYDLEQELLDEADRKERAACEDAEEHKAESAREDGRR